MEDYTKSYDTEDTGAINTQSVNQPHPGPTLQPTPIVTKEKKPRRWLVRFLMVVIVLFLLAATAAAVYFWQNQKLNDLKLDNAKLSSQVEDLQSQLDRAMATSSLGESIEPAGDIQQNADISFAKSIASSVATRANAYASNNRYFPTIKDLESAQDNSLKDIGISVVDSPDKLNEDNAKSAVAYIPCGANQKYTGFSVYYYDIGTKAPIEYTDTVGSSSCN